MQHVKLNNEKLFPTPGFGCGLLQTTDPVDLEAVLDRALDLGYRHFDTAYVYRNEKILGKVFAKWLKEGRVKREELFITTKLPEIGMDPSRVRYFLQLSLDALQLENVDLYLIHSPTGSIYVNDIDFYPKAPDGSRLLDLCTDLEAVWKEMEAQVEAGLTKSIGISNFTEGQVRRIIKSGEIVPSNIQVELHAYFQQKELQAFCKDSNIVISASEFVSPPLLADPCVTELAQKYRKTPAQILLRHLSQLGIVPVVSSSNSQRLAENLRVFDFELAATDLENLNDLDKGEAGRSFTAAIYAGSANHPEFPY